MKSLISGIAVVVLLMVFNVFQVEHDRYLRAQEYIKVQCDDMAAGGALFFQEDEYARGRKIFDKEVSEGIIKQLIISNLKLDNSLIPRQDSFWESIEYETYYIDDSGYMVTYQNGVFKELDAFEYSSYLSTQETGEIKLITEPTVVVVVWAKYTIEQCGWISWPEIVRSSAYEYIDRN